jgi:hypothetical protein
MKQDLIELEVAHAELRLTRCSRPAMSGRERVTHGDRNAAEKRSDAALPTS